MGIQHYINLLSPYIHGYGYWVAFFGLMLENAGVPIPGETALIVVSFYAGQGLLNIWIVVPLAIIGDLIGDSIGYAIGRYFPVKNRANLAPAEALFREKGGRTVFASQFSAVSRATGSIAAGLARMPFKRFITYDTAAATVLVSIVAAVTFHFSKNLDAVVNFFRVFRLAGLAIFVLIILVFMYHYYKKKR